MTKQKLRLLGAGIILLGLILAMPFRRLARGLPLPVAPVDEAPEFEETGDVKGLELSSTSAEDDPSPPPRAFNSTAAAGPSEPRRLGRRVASTSSGSTDPTAASTPQMARDYRPALTPMLPPRPLSPDERSRTHKLVDGDNLPALAARYLGSHHRYQEILQANPGLHPNLLPLGRRIVIPPRKVTRPAEETRAQTKLVPFGQ